MLEITKVRIFYFLKDLFFPHETLYIQDQISFENSLKDIESKKILAVDTEFIWRNTYFPKLSLVQICTGKKIYIIDCMSISILKLENVLANENILKIFHSIRNDASIFFNCLEIKLNNIFDTQLAENFIEKNKNKGDQISYKKLVNRYFFRNILKSETNSDWKKRPLSSKQLDYAAEDVRYLISIMKIQKGKLKKLKMLDRFKNQCDQEKKLGEEHFSLSRIRRFKKKNKNVSKVDLKIFEWRENQAKKLDVPPSHIIEDRDIKKLKNIVDKKKIKEFRWIIKKDASRDDFINLFL